MLPSGEERGASGESFLDGTRDVDLVADVVQFSVHLMRNAHPTAADERHQTVLADASLKTRSIKA